jgi:hypothetical protein
MILSEASIAYSTQNHDGSISILDDMQELKTDVLVVGGGTGGTAAAIQAARRGAQTILVSEFPWLGGMLTAAGVTAPDGNELAAFQTGIWGAFLRALQQRQLGGLDHAWVSFFTYDPRIGAEIFADWVRELPNLYWITGQIPLEVQRKSHSLTGQSDRLTHVRFADYKIQAKIILDATELGDLLALAEVPHRWGWEWQSEWDEPSAPIAPYALTEKYPVQSPTWVVVLQDFGEAAPVIPAPPIDQPEQFQGAWQGYGAESFLNYGRLPGNRWMINWPQQGNDYGDRLERLVQSPSARLEFLQEAQWHSQSFARFIQTHLDRRYGLAESLFPKTADGLGGGAYALHPYYRESRRLQGLVTVREQDILPQVGGWVAALPLDQAGQVEAIAIGNYANDHHYPGMQLPLQSKSIRWGGRWTGTPFTIPYRCLVPANTGGLLVCEKNISVSHIANGATRLQPVVLAIGQAAGMAAALCIEQNCQPQALPVRLLQEALLKDAIAPAAVIPLFNLPPDHPDWLYWQGYYLNQPETYPTNGSCPLSSGSIASPAPDTKSDTKLFSGVFWHQGWQDYVFTLRSLEVLKGQTLENMSEQRLKLVTLHSEVDQQLQRYSTGQYLEILGRLNPAGKWLLVESVISSVISDEEMM